MVHAQTRRNALSNVGCVVAVSLFASCYIGVRLSRHFAEDPCHGRIGDVLAPIRSPHTLSSEAGARVTSKQDDSDSQDGSRGVHTELLQAGMIARCPTRDISSSRTQTPREERVCELRRY